ncbi:hypothetical protein CRE_31620 [Caenorhabditis remanei]|uniref:Cysteine-rich protein 1 n=1 Tax=Caenorhabditis remanei TaxID=31234 RepID=E3NSB9_CAERE|nr:hypothetical protein CRE_31620 [Caenorhabditis remanei]
MPFFRNSVILFWSSLFLFYCSHIFFSFFQKPTSQTDSNEKMPNCPRCQKPVYFAERVTSIGFDWHRPCLRCENEACKKTLAAGSHSEREGKPYCNRCYGAMFGPRGYGHGGVESHTFHQGQTSGQSAVVKTKPL